MSGRRTANRIRGPQSALTDFLAANNISAAQIRDDYERRRDQQQREQQDDDAEAEASNIRAQAVEFAAAVTQAVLDLPAANQRKRRSVKDLEDNEDGLQTQPAKKGHKADKKKSIKKKRKGDDSDDDDDYQDDDLVKDMYKKSRPAPGQLEHCEQCSKRFTVTPYTKEGPDGGLMCAHCGKQMAKDLKKEERAKAPKPRGRKRRKLESNKLDGFANRGTRTLQQICIEKIAAHHDDVEELGDVPQSVVERLSEIFSKKRLLKSKTLPLFLRPDIDSVIVHDAAYLEPGDYHKMFAVVPKMRRLILGNACQFKDEELEYMLERCENISHFQVYAANLVSNKMWHRFFVEIGGKLETLKLKWLDAAFEDDTVKIMVHRAPGLKRVKLKLCRRLTGEAVDHIAELSHLEHLSLQISSDVETSYLLKLVEQRGPQLRTLSLEKFLDADDSVLQAIHQSCTQLRKLRFSENDTATDTGFVSLFTGWANPPLTFIDLNSNRDVDNNNPDGPEDAVGLASAGFKAMMAHSGAQLRRLDIACCRHITLGAFLDVFNPTNQYPELESINISFCSRVDTTVVAGIFKSCPKLKRLVAFGCFGINNVVVPKDIALIGVPKAQDAIEQFGVGIDVEEALGKMLELGA